MENFEHHYNIAIFSSSHSVCYSSLKIKRDRSIIMRQSLIKDSLTFQRRRTCLIIIEHKYHWGSSRRVIASRARWKIGLNECTTRTIVALSSFRSHRSIVCRRRGNEGKRNVRRILATNVD